MARSSATVITSPGRARNAVALPTEIAPMLATSADQIPGDLDQWACEYKWDGVRSLFFWDGRRARMLSRNLLDMTNRYPELAPFGKAIGKKPAILDGEIVALDPGTVRPSFPRLQHRMHVQHPSSDLCKQVPIFYILFDLLHLGNQSLREESYVERRAQLESLALHGPAWQLSPSFPGSTTSAMLDAAHRQGLEGVVVKRLTSIYEPGRRSRDWLKLKVIHGQELVIGGWIPEHGDANGHRVGALMLGYYDRAGKTKSPLHYAGSVGSGFTAETHALLYARLTKLRTDRNPFSGSLPKRGVMYVKPQLVADIEFRRWPSDGYIHQAAFKGLRFDKEPSQVVREDLVFDSQK